MALDVILEPTTNMLVSLLLPSHAVEDQSLHGQGLYIHRKNTVKVSLFPLLYLTLSNKHTHTLSSFVNKSDVTSSKVLQMYPHFLTPWIIHTPQTPTRTHAR